MAVKRRSGLVLAALAALMLSGLPLASLVQPWPLPSASHSPHFLPSLDVAILFPVFHPPSHSLYSQGCCRPHASYECRPRP
ncbi:unnamed protein product [Closterium sp. NIES-65]|nr:unnamed protein product [Closterium sp. NIES-65]